MCGIAGFHLKKPGIVKKHEGVEVLVDELLKGIEHRGKHATGFVSVGNDGRVQLDKAAKTATDFIKDREKIPEGVQTVLLHTRYATQGSKDNHVNNHPVMYGTCFAIHNGHINNDTALFNELGLKRGAEVDSEAIAAVLAHDGFDDLPKSFARLRGNMATAVIDPVKYPKKLILTRGYDSPLFVVENDNFLVWASTEKAIKDAWGKVLGTPPSDKNIERIVEGTIIIIDDGESTRLKFDVPRPFGFQSWQPNERTETRKNRNTGKSGRNSASGSASVFIGEGSEDSNDGTVVKSKKENIAFAAGDDSSARRWSKRDTYGSESFKDVPKMEDRRWIPCYGCEDAVLHLDMQDSAWGHICIDCYAVTMKKVSAHYEANKPGFLAGTEIPRIPMLDRDTLEGWAEKELNIHRLTLNAVSNQCGSYYSPQMINYLLFLTTPEYREECASSVKDLMRMLHEAYDQTWFNVCEDFELENDRPKQQKVGELLALHMPLLGPVAATNLWGYCGHHDEAYKTTEGCKLCNDEAELDSLFDRQANADTGGEDYGSCGVQAFAEGREGLNNDNVITLPQCPDCKTYVLRDGGKCAVCDSLKKEPKLKELEVLKVPITKEKHSCVKCNHKARFIVGKPGAKQVAYCKKHYLKCWRNDKCKGKNFDANHVLANGERLCHLDVRGVSGALSDKTLIKRGVVITEV